MTAVRHLGHASARTLMPGIDPAPIPAPAERDLTDDLGRQAGLLAAALDIIARWATVALSQPPDELRAELAGISQYAAGALSRASAGQDHGAGPVPGTGE